MAEIPLLPVTRIAGLFLAGQNILLPGVLGGIVSAALAVGFALGHDNALKEFRACASNV
jgi:all-trans-retinol 13,14-reductase